MLQKLKSLFGISTLEKNQMTTLSDRDKEEKKGFRYRIKSKPVAVTLGMKEFKQALELAKKFDKPKWNALIDQYEVALFDCHLSAQIYNRKQKVLKQKFAIFENEKINDEKTKLVQKPFFYDFIDLSLDALFFGNSLVEFSSMNDQGEFTEVHLIPRQHVSPSDGVIYFNLSDQRGYDYRDKKVKENAFLFEVNNGDFGLLAKATPQAIRKTYSLEDWSIKCEKFGQPFIALFTDEQDKELLDEYQNMLTNMGANGYGIFGSKDRNMIEYIEANSGQGAYQTFSELIKFCNEEISKLIAGGTGTTDEKAFVGTAELHERMLNDIVDADMRYTESLITYNLIPFLVSHGYPLEGCEFRFVMPEKEKEQKKDSPNTTEEKKKEQKTDNELSVKKSFGTIILPTNSDDCCTLKDDDKAEFDINLASFIKQIFEGKLKKGEISKSVFRIYNEILQAAISEGYENIPDSDKAFYNELSYNQSVFAAFKTHSIGAKLAEQLTDENGQLRTFSEFQKAVNPLLDNYNKNWLRAEYNTSVASAQAAKKWQQIQRDKDLFPYLQFKTQNDKAVRGEHKRLHNIIRKVDDSFWNTHYAPLAYNCRCYVIQLEEGTETKLPKDLPQPKEGFEENVGKTARIFDVKKSSYSEGTTLKKVTSFLKNVANIVIPKKEE
ncbi:DUF935 family protein [Bernardetia sp. Wsw4-3y2]|uniref:phage portal protein family protein n=1 Tax=Bernardetia sp. Wsw4-3y2 TaxID=3127471 RepID=UPI0030CBDCC7